MSLSNRTVMVTIHQPSMDIFEVRPPGMRTPASRCNLRTIPISSPAEHVPPAPPHTCALPAPPPAPAQQFTELVLLQRGGRLTYVGPLGGESAALVAYLEAQPGVEPIK